MKKVLVFDELGNYLEDKIEHDQYEPTENEFETSLSEVVSFYSPKLVNGEVVEGLSQEEIDEFKNTPVPPTDIEVLGKQLVQEKLEKAQLKNQVNFLGQEIVKLKLGGL